jgi:hypothetical protein
MTRSGRSCTSIAVERLEDRLNFSVPPGLEGYEGQPGNQGGNPPTSNNDNNNNNNGTPNGLKGYEGQPGNQGGHGG